MVEHNYVSRWMAPLLALCLQFEVGATAAYAQLPNIFEVDDPRFDAACSDDLGGAMNIGEAAKPAPLASVDAGVFQSSRSWVGFPHGRTTDVASGSGHNENGHASLPPVDAGSEHAPCTVSFPREVQFLKRGSLHRVPHAVPLRVAFADRPDGCASNAWGRQLNRVAAGCPAGASSFCCMRNPFPSPDCSSLLHSQSQPVQPVAGTASSPALRPCRHVDGLRSSGNVSARDVPVSCPGAPYLTSFAQALPDPPSDPSAEVFPATGCASNAWGRQLNRVAAGCPAGASSFCCMRDPFPSPDCSSLLHSQSQPVQPVAGTASSPALRPCRHLDGLRSSGNISARDVPVSCPGAPYLASFARVLPDPPSDQPAEVFPATREQLPTQPHVPICRFKVGSLSSLGDKVLPGVAPLPECPRAAPDSAAELPGLSMQSRQGPVFQGSVPREPLVGEPHDELMPTYLPAGPFVRPCHGRAPPTTFSEVQLLVAAQTAVYPAWLSGPLLNTPFGTLVRLAGPSPSVQEDALFTIFEKNTEALVKRWLPGWTALDLVACALSHVPYRVRAAAFLERPLPGYPTPQIVLTAASLPRSFRAIPIDLRPLSGLVHTISVDCPSLTRTAWQVLRDKGATLCRAGAPVEDAAAPGFLDESRDPAPRIDDFHPEWLTVPAQLGGDQADLHIMYPGDPAYVQREPPDGAAAAALPNPGTVPSNGADSALGNEAVSLLQTVVELQTDAEPKGMMMPPGAPNPDIDPPALLLTAGHPCLTKDGQEHRPDAQPAVQPAYLRQAFFENERVDLFSWGAVGPADQGLFTIFDPERHVTVARRPPEPTLPHLVEAAVTGAPFRVDGVQVLMHTVPGYPLPQLVLRPTDAPRGFFPVPWDLRAAGTALRTVNHQPGETMESAVRRLAAVVANAEVCRQINAGRMTVLDVAGILHMLDMIPRDLQQIQHFRVEPTVARVGQERLRYVSAGPTWAAPASGLTSTTTTSLVPYGPAVECRLVVLLGTCSSSASIAPPCLQIDAIIERLVLEVIAQFGQPVENIHVMLAAGQPPMTHGVQEVLMMVCGPSLDSIPTVIIDERANGHPLGAYSVASCTPVAELVDAAWQARGVRAIVNGAPQHVIPKWATTGDFVQFADSGHNPDFTPTTYVMQLLRFWNLTGGRCTLGRTTRA